MKKLLGVLFGAVLMVGLLGGAMAGAQSKIGIVDLAIVIDESDAGKAANAQLAQFIAARQADLDTLEGQITGLETELSGESLAAADRSAKQTQIDQLVNDYMTRMNTYENEIQQVANVLRQNVLAEIGAVLQWYGDNNGFDMILDASAVLYYRRVVDLTYDIIREYNALRAEGALQPADAQAEAQEAPAAE